MNANGSFALLEEGKHQMLYRPRPQAQRSEGPFAGALLVETLWGLPPDRLQARDSIKLGAPGLTSLTADKTRNLSRLGPTAEHTRIPKVLRYIKLDQLCHDPLFNRVNLFVSV